MDNTQAGKYTFLEAAVISVVFLYIVISSIDEVLNSEDSITAIGAVLLAIGSLGIASIKLIKISDGSVMYGIVAHGLTVGVSLMVIQYAILRNTLVYAGFMAIILGCSLYLLIDLRRRNPEA